MTYYVHDRILDDEQIETLLDLMEHSEFEPATVYSRGEEKRPRLNRDSRDAMNSRVKFLEFPDICLSLKELAETISFDWPEDLYFKEMEFLKYTAPSGKFKIHNDDSPPDYELNRYFTSITLLGKSDDLEGGELKLYRDDGIVSTTVPLELYDTVIFPAHHLHECTTLTKGWRNVLVVWAGKWSPQYS